MKMSFRNEGEMNTLLDKEKWRAYFKQNWDEMIEFFKGKWHYQGEAGIFRNKKRTTELINDWINIQDYISPLSVLYNMYDSWKQKS